MSNFYSHDTHFRHTKHTDITPYSPREHFENKTKGNGKQKKTTWKYPSDREKVEKEEEKSRR